MKGKVVLVPFPFTSLKGTKLRPALVLFEGTNDVTLVFISSRIERYNPKTDVLIEQSHPEFQLTGLKVSSFIRLTKIATVQKDILPGELGEIGPLIKKEINRKVCSLLVFEP
ncbi:type II toxin-antitoxin system PemK/MazF family toxin [Thermococcus sp. JdF3]|uniref:type II toxin-antitoxin system PemK/MazF family toxin n=1 Tax=Thermococcus sp. JdF3 TaxID=1638258 RepID=UPI00143C49CC|nr:type II toxin-antitoxin system PemK/MazF family toxin [Thermococcus sp. JdF3]NJE01703.1 type II toxin-antitoxin system PemK/MazF family toxin [Thermococcus sp. JdF3]